MVIERYGNASIYRAATANRKRELGDLLELAGESWDRKVEFVRSFLCVFASLVFCVGSWGLGSYPPSMGLRSPQSVVSHLPVLVELELRVLPALVDEPEDLTTKFSTCVWSPL